MRSSRRSSQAAKKRRGATLVLLVLLMTVIVALVAFAVDVARMYVVRAQLQSAVDAGTLAAALQLRENDEDVDAAVAAAEQFVQLNRVGWLRTVPADAIAITPGTWDDATSSFTSSVVDPDSVRVFARQENEPLFFAGVLGLDKFAVPRDAVATLGGGSLDIMMVLDMSGSMGSQGRIEALRSAAPVFVSVIQENGSNDRIGMMGYGALIGSYSPSSRGHSGTVYLNAPAEQYPNNGTWAAVLEADLTYDLTALTSNVLDSSTLIHNRYSGWTPVGAAIRDAAHYLDVNGRDGVTKALVLMSDGHANKPNGNGPGYARSMASYAASLNIAVYTISLGNAADEQLMEDIAATTGGKHFLASGSGTSELTTSLSEAFRKVAKAVKGTQIVQ